MAQCKDCIHNGVCKIYSGFIKNHDCELFVSTADVVPKSEVEKAKQEVAREIFEELELLMKIYTFPVVKSGVIEIVKEPFWCIEPNDFTTIKKKYTKEGEGNI